MTCTHENTDESYGWDDVNDCEYAYDYCVDCGETILDMTEVIADQRRESEYIASDEVDWCSPLSMEPIYDSFSLAEGETRRHLCPDCGASVEAHSALYFSYIPAHPVRITPDPRLGALFAKPQRIAVIGDRIDVAWWTKHLPEDHPLMRPVV